MRKQRFAAVMSAFGEIRCLRTKYPGFFLIRYETFRIIFIRGRHVKENLRWKKEDSSWQRFMKEQHSLSAEHLS